jgi:hypothetical protein
LVQQFFDFYIYANAAVLVFPNCFFLRRTVPIGFTPPTFSIAFFLALGSAVFGHYGDKAQNYVGNCFIDDGYFNSFHWFFT